MSKWLRKNDEVLVITGNDRGKKGKIIALRGEKVVIQGVNVRKKHMRKSQAQPKGQILDIECPIHRSNVALCVDGNAVKLRVRENKKGERELYYRSESGEPVVYRMVRRG